MKKVWEFFSDPGNLALLMPEDMGFRALDAVPSEMYQGLILRYSVTPLAGVRLPWASRIEVIKPGEYFIDTQSEGPFKFWHHEHRFEPAASGTLIKDILHYRLPLEPVSKLFHHSIVRKKLDNIFRVRKERMTELF